MFGSRHRKKLICSEQVAIAGAVIMSETGGRIYLHGEILFGRVHAECSFMTTHLWKTSAPTQNQTERPVPRAMRAITNSPSDTPFCCSGGNLSTSSWRKPKHQVAINCSSFNSHDLTRVYRLSKGIHMSLVVIVTISVLTMTP